MLLTVTALRSPQTLRRLPVPWAMAAGFAGLSAAVALLQHTGWLAAVATAVGEGTGLADLLQVSAATGVLANATHNLPAYLLVEPAVADQPSRLLAALIGANAGPLVTPWASLVTLLWLQRCRAAGLRWRLGRLAVAGLLCSSLCVTAAVVALWATTP